MSNNLEDRQSKMLFLAGPPTSIESQKRLSIYPVQPLEGSVRKTCQDCGEEFWLGPKQQAAEQSPEYEDCERFYVCFFCASRLYTKIPVTTKACGDKGHGYSGAHS